MKIILIVSVLFLVVAHADEFSHGKYEAWPSFEHPKGYSLTNDSFKGEAYKWVAFLKSGDNFPVISVSPYGFVDQSWSATGFENARDVVLISEGGTSNFSRNQKKGYEILTFRKKTEINVIFLRSDKRWGLCYNSLKIAGGTLEQREDVYKITVSSFTPSFAKEPQTNQ